MKNIEKRNWGYIFLGGLIIAAGGWWLTRRAKETYKELKRREKLGEELMKNAGLTEDAVTTLPPRPGDPDYGVDMKINLPYMLFEKGRFESLEIPQEYFDSDRIFTEKGTSEHVVHVRQRFDKQLRRNLLDLIFEIPRSAVSPNIEDRSSNDGYTSIGNFIYAFKGDKINNNNDFAFSGGLVNTIRNIINDPQYGISDLKVVPKNPIVSNRLVGYYFMKYDVVEDGEVIKASAMLPIPETHYEGMKLSDYVHEINVKLDKRERIDISLSDPRVQNVEVGDIILGYCITLKMNDAYNIDGINVNSGLAILRYIADEFEVLNRTGRGKFQYLSFLFYDEWDEEDELRYYDVAVNKETGRYQVCKGVLF